MVPRKWLLIIFTVAHSPAGTIMHLLLVKHFYCVALRVSQGRPASAEQGASGTGRECGGQYCESEGTVQNTPFQMSEEKPSS